VSKKLNNVLGRSLTVFLLGLILSRVSLAAISADGLADEPEWAQAAVITGFTSVDPFTGEAAPYPVVARVVATPEGLAVWARAEVPPEIRSHGRSQRDAARMDADPIRLMVDFEGEGHTAYEFTISMANSVRDGVLAKGRPAPTYDWDGIWFHGAYEDERGWNAEWLIPWSSVPTSSGQGDERVIGVWFAQFIKRMAHGYGYPAISSASPNFIAGMHKITVPRYSTARLDWFPYASLSSDRLNDRMLGRAGLDIAWKPQGPHQFTATVNPDFGQVESDDLVVNFSAIETFFSEKRPFFTENQSVFDLRLPDEGRLINTRRIGGNADAGPLGASEIITAAKYTGIINKFELGAFAALEDDSDLAKGRRYFVGRGNYRGERVSLGWMGSVVDRPTLDRTATVQSLDFEFSPKSSVSLRGQALASLVDAPGAHDGLGMWLNYRNDPQQRFGQEYELLWYDRNLELNDLGYQPRRSLRALRGAWDIYRRKLPDSSRLAFTRLELTARLAQNDFGKNLPAVFQLEREWRFRKPHGINLKFQYDTSGFDDLITRGGAAVRIPSRYSASLFTTEQSSTRVRTEVEIKVFEEGVRGKAAVQSYLLLTYYFTPEFSTNIQATWIDSPDWFAFIPGINELAAYRKRQWILRQGISWFPSQKQELRARLQWVGLQADGRQAYDIAANGQLLPRSSPATSFQRSELGLQLRYRYELKALSDLFLVYTRGGLYRSTGDDGFQQLWSGVNDNPNQDQFVVKLRYQF
jgi:hypothetical protein